MSYRSKRTFSSTEEEAPAPDKNRPPSSSLTPSQLSKTKSTEPSTQKWGPFSPATLGSKSFGILSQPTKKPTTTKEPTNSTSFSSMVAPESSTPQSNSMTPRPHLNTSSIPDFTQTSQPSFSLSQHQTPSTNTRASQPQKKGAQPSLFQHMNKRAMVHLPPKATQQSNAPTTMQPPNKAMQPPIKPMQPPNTATKQVIRSSSTSTKSQYDKAGVAASKYGMSTPPPTHSEMAVNKTRPENLFPIPNVSSLNSNNQVSPAYMNRNVNRTTSRDRSTPSIHVESEVIPNNLEESEESASECEEPNAEGQGVMTAKKSKPRRPSKVPFWPDKVEFDEKEEVIAIDVNGKKHLVKGSVQPRDVWHDTLGFKYYVIFNEFCQPLGKGGSILVSFLGDIAKKEKYCPVGKISWRDMSQKVKTDIVDLVRQHFVLPDGIEGKLIDLAILKRTDNYWKQYRYKLKKNHFDPVNKSLDDIYDDLPDGVSKTNWSDLVDYWLSDDAKKYSAIGKAARASLGHFHKSGATSFANRRADLKREKGEFSELDFFKKVYANKDGSFEEGGISRQFLDEANSKLQENLACSSSSKSRIEIENDIFEELMYNGEVPKRPLNYGFGVKKNDIFGVEGLLRKKGSRYAYSGAMEVENLKDQLSVVKKQNEALAQQNKVLDGKFDETTKAFKAIASYLGQVFKEVRSGTVSSELLDGAESAIHMINSNDSSAKS